MRSAECAAKARKNRENVYRHYATGPREVNQISLQIDLLIDLQIGLETRRNQRSGGLASAPQS
jgi:hypothetical protein